jgi:hypothetical protein
VHLQLPYKETELAVQAKKLLHSCYALTQSLPEGERNNLTEVLRRSVLMAYMDICRGAMAKKERQRKAYKRAGQALVVVDAALECIRTVGLASAPELNDVSYLLISVYNLLKKEGKNA